MNTENTTPRRFLFDVRPQHRETLDSYTSRLLRANFETDDHLKRLLRDRKAKKSTANSITAEILSTRTGRNIGTLAPHPTAWEQHPDGSSCDTCHELIPERHMCALCAHGAHVKQYPHLDDIVCIRHRRWVGLHSTWDMQGTVDDTTLHAAITWEKLRRRNRADAYLYQFLLTAVTNSKPDTSRRQNNERDAFSTVVAIAQLITARAFQMQMFSLRPANIWRHIEQELERIEADLDDKTALRVATYCRPTAAALLHAARTRNTYQQQWPHDLTLPEPMVNNLIKKIDPQAEFDYFPEDLGHEYSEKFLTDYDLARTTHNAERGKIRLHTCDEGHPYTGTNCSSNERPTNCTLCNRRVLVAGINDLGTTHPEIAAEFDKEANYPLRVDEIHSNRKTRCVWKCPKGHSYSTAPINRTIQHSRCPVCQNRVIVAGVNDFASTHPELASEWVIGTGKNNPNAHPAGGNYLATWKCDRGHIYKMRIFDRTNGHGCPTCCHLVSEESGNTLDVTHPKIASEWDYERNNGLAPTDVSFGSNRTIQWKCQRGHFFLYRIDERTFHDRGCPVCANTNFRRGTNDIRTLHPDLVAEFSTSLNEITPDQIIAGNNSYLWKCHSGHTHRQTLNQRRKTRGCPLCPQEERILNRSN